MNPHTTCPSKTLAGTGTRPREVSRSTDTVRSRVRRGIREDVGYLLPIPGEWRPRRGAQGRGEYGHPDPETDRVLGTYVTESAAQVALSEPHLLLKLPQRRHRQITVGVGHMSARQRDLPRGGVRRPLGTFDQQDLDALTTVP